MSRATNQQIAQGFSQGLQNFVQGYTKRKEKESAQKILDDPKSTPVQKAIAWESISEGSGQKSFDSFLKEQELVKQEKVDSAIMNDLFGGGQKEKEDVGQRAGVGKVDMASLTPVQQAQQSFPGYKNFGQPQQQEAPPEQQAGQEQVMAPEEMQAGQEQGQSEPQGTLSQVPTQKLQAYLAASPSKNVKDVLTSELKRRESADKAQAIRDAAMIKTQETSFQKNRNFAAQENAPYKKRIDGLKAATPVRSRAVEYARQAVKSGDVGRLSLNHLADVLKMPSLKNEQGALLDQAIKTNLIGTLSEVTAKATNIFLERVALDAFARAGNTEGANLMKLEALDTELKLNALETEVYNKILKQDIESFGHEQPYISMRVEEEMKPLQKDIIDRAAWKMKKYQEASKSYGELYENAFQSVEPGTPLTQKMGEVILDKSGGDTKKAKAVAKRLGYTVYSKEQRQKYDQ